MAAQSVGEAERVQMAEPLSVRQALIGLRAIQEPGVTYATKFLNEDGRILRHYARTPSLEAWLVCVPVNDDQSRDRSRQMLVCPISVPFEGNDEWRLAQEYELRGELESLLREGI